MLSILVSLLPTLKNFIIILAFSNKRTNFVYLLLEAKPTAKLPPKRDTVPFDETIKRNASHAHNFISGNVWFVTYAMTGFTWNHPALSKPLSPFSFFFLPFHAIDTRSTCVSICGHCTLLHVPRPFTEGPRNTATLNNLFSQVNFVDVDGEKDREEQPGEMVRDPFLLGCLSFWHGD